MIKIAPSLASAPLINLEKVIQELEQADADILHFDLEDGSFVPEMRLGIKIIADLRRLTKLPFDVHLMVNNPEWLIPHLASIGVNKVSVHYEACPYPRRTIGIIAQAGMSAGLAFNPKTEVPDLAQYSPFLSFVLILTTEPELGECPFLPSVLQKVRAGKKQFGCSSLQWVVDGGINLKNIAEVIDAGADIVVSGRGIFGEKSVDVIQKMKRAGINKSH